MERRWGASVKPHSIAKDDSVRVRLMSDRQWRSAGAVASGRDKFEKSVGKEEVTRPDRGNSICNVVRDFLRVTVSVGPQSMSGSGFTNQGVGLMVSEARRSSSATKYWRLEMLVT
jgi:hypothetical protein